MPHGGIIDNRPTLFWRFIVIAAHLTTTAFITLISSPIFGMTYLAAVLIWGSWKRRAARGQMPRPARLQFTREGKYMVGITVGVGLAAINTGNNLLYLFLGMLLSLIITSGILSEITLRGLRVVRHFPDRVFARKAFLASVKLENNKRLVPSFGIQVDDFSEGLGRSKRCFFLKVPAQSRQTTSYRTEFQRRGLYTYRSITLITRFPFAFFIKQRVLSDDTTVVVFPAIHPQDTRLAQPQGRRGDSPADKKGLGREFFGLSDYQPGQDARDIHWRRSAALDRLVLREYGSDVAPTTTIILNDILPSDPDSDTDMVLAVDLCVEWAASLLVHGQARGEVLVLHSRQKTWKVGPNRTGLDECLRDLALLSFLDSNSERPLTRVPIDGSCYVISLATTRRSAPTVAGAKLLCPEA